MARLLSTLLILSVSLFSLGMGTCAGGLGTSETTVLKLHIDSSMLSAAELAQIEEVVVTVAGAVPAEMMSFDFANEIEAEMDPIQSNGKLFLRLTTRAGLIDLTAETQQIPVTAGATTIEATFQLKPIQSPNGCRFVQTATTLMNGAPVGGFDFVYDNSNFHVVYSDRTSDMFKIFHASFSELGVLTSAPVQLDPRDFNDSNYSSNQLTLVKMGSYFYVAWEENNKSNSEKQIVIRKLAASGSPIGNASSFAVGPVSESRPSLATSGGKLALAWKQSVAGVEKAMVAEISTNTLLPAGTPLVLDSSAQDSGYPSIAPKADGFGILWNRRDTETSPFNVNFGLLDLNFTLSSAQTIRSNTGDALLTRLFSTPTSSTTSGFIAAWEDNRFTDRDEQVATAAISSDAGTVTERFVVDPTETGSANWPNIASGNSAHALVYYQFRDSNPGPQVFLTKLALDGSRVGSGDLQVSQNFAGSRGARFPDIAAINAQGLNQFGVMWIEENGANVVSTLTFARISCD